MSRGINKFGQFRVRFGTIDVPHLGYTVRVKRLRRGVDGADPGWIAYAKDVGGGVAELYFNEWCSPPTVAHEVVHVVQYICRRKSIAMVKEMEHVAYLTDYLTAKVLGYRPDTTGVVR